MSLARSLQLSYRRSCRARSLSHAGSSELLTQMGDRLETETIYSLLNIITVHSDINLNEAYLKCVASYDSFRAL